MPKILADFPDYQELSAGITQWGQDVGDATVGQDLPCAVKQWVQYLAAGSGGGQSRGDVWCYEPGSASVASVQAQTTKEEAPRLPSPLWLVPLLCVLIYALRRFPRARRSRA